MLKFDSQKFIASDGSSIFYYSTPRLKNSRCALLIVHGMAEHAERYTELADHLYRNGVVVYAIDQRGHGKTGQYHGTLGWFAEQDGWQRIVSDIGELSHQIKNTHPDLPLFILGHSMGSVAVRSALIRFGSLYQGGFIVGTTMGINGAVRQSGRLIAKAEIARYGSKHPSRLLTALSFGGYNKKVKENRTDMDWLSARHENVDTYLADPLCGFTCTSAFFYDLFSGIDFANDPKHLKQMPTELPIILLSGQDDPVGGMGKEVLKLKERLEDCGMKHVHLTLYPHKRHELLNEDSRYEVYEHILKFINIYG